MKSSGLGLADCSYSDNSKTALYQNWAFKVAESRFCLSSMKRAPRTDIGDVEPAAQKVQNGTRGDKVVQVKR